MATGDIIACEIDSTGSFAYLTIEGWSARAGLITYNYGDVVGGAGNIRFTVVSEGYDLAGNLGTVTRTVQAYDTVRKPKPDDASLDEVAVGSDLKIRVALDYDIYDDDNTGAGKSGTAPTVTVAAGWATSSSPAESNNAVTALTATNSSTLDYPPTFGQHDPYAGTLMRSRVTSDFPVAFNARHGEHVSCVRWNATGQTSGHTQEAFATVQTATQRTASGLYACAYGATIPLAGFTQGELITVRMRAYPVVGDANSVLDTNGRTLPENECLGWNDLIVTCDKDNLLGAVKYVSTTGNDTTGDGSSGNPWATVNKAIKDTGTFTVKLMGTGTTYDLTFSGTRRTAARWVVVEPDTGATPTVRMINTSAAARRFAVERLMFRGLPVTKSAADSYLDGQNADNFLAFVNCTFNDNGFGTNSSDAGPGWQADACYIINCDGDLCVGQWRIRTFSTTRSAYVFDGVPFAADVGAVNSLDAWYRVVACSCGNQSFLTKPAGNPAPAQNGCLFESNSCLDVTLSGLSVFRLDVATTGLSMVGNLVEKTAGSGPEIHLWADNTAASATHIIVAHNTFVGSGSGRRCNLFYNDSGTTPYNHRSVFFYGNHIDEGNIKSDAFGHIAGSITRSGSTATIACASEDGSIRYTVGQNIFVEGAAQPEYNGTFAVASSSGATTGGTISYTVSGTPTTPATGTITYFGLGRVGNWAQLYGSKWRANNIDTLSSASFDWENLGIDGTRDTPTWENAAANDYTPVAGSSLLNRVSRPYIPFDLYGRRVAGSAAVGAVQRVTAGVVPFIGCSFQGIIGG